MIRARSVVPFVLALSSTVAFAQQKAATPAAPATPAKGATPAPAAGAPAKPAEPAKPATPADKATPPADKAATPPAGGMTPEQMAEMTKPAAELANVNWLAGNWKCDSKMFDPMSGAENDTKTTLKNAWDLDKHWLASDMSSKKTKTFPAFHGKGFLGYDTAQKKYFFGGVDNWGGMMALWTAGGTDSWVWEGNMSMGPMMAKTRWTWTKKSDKEFTATMEVQMPAQGGMGAGAGAGGGAMAKGGAAAGEWKKLGEDSCKK